MANLKMGVSREQSSPNFSKNDYFLPLKRTRILPYYRRIEKFKSNDFVHQCAHLPHFGHN